MTQKTPKELGSMEDEEERESRVRDSEIERACKKKKRRNLVAYK